MPALRVVIAEDEEPIRELLVHQLGREGFRCIETRDGPSTLRAMRAGCDLLILDVGLPAVDGFDVLRTLRREGRMQPVLILTARSDEVDRVIGLELGADDYVVKPFSPRELVARVRSLIRRGGLPADSGPAVLRFARLEIDEAAREARIDGAGIGLKPREFALLLELASSPGVAFARSALVERVWGLDFDGDERTVDVHVRRLREKLEDVAGLPRVLHTVHGFGYKFARS